MATKKEEIKKTKVAEDKSAAAEQKNAKAVSVAADKASDKKASQKVTAKPQDKPVEKTTAAKKSPAKKYHIAQRADDNMWQVKAEGAEKALKLFKTQQEAIDYAKKVADNQEGSIMIHKKDGSFRKLTY